MQAASGAIVSANVASRSVPEIAISRSSPRAAKICSLSSSYRGFSLKLSAVRCCSAIVGRMPMIIMCAPTVRALSSAQLRLVLTSSSSSENIPFSSSRGGMLISTLNWPSSVWKSLSAIASSASALIIAGSPASSVRLSSISSPTERRSASKRASLSMRANTSRQVRTFWR